jgi:Tol biopolymer transport system component/DNA-binding winged helix-turn-helix (wHTH) protein
MSRDNARMRFGEFEADLQSRELFRSGARISLPNQSFLALAALLERPGQLVSREELRARLWPDKRVVEFEQGLNAIINRLREAMGDSAADPKFIETLPRRGYRFIATVSESAPDEDRRDKRRLIYKLAIGLCAVVGLFALTFFFASQSDNDEVSNLTITPLTSLIGRELAPAFSPDGERLVFGWNGHADGAGGFDLYMKHADSEETVRLTHDPADALSSAWSHDGAQIAFARRSAKASGIYLIPSTGGPERLLARAEFLDEPFMQLSWSPGDRLLAYSAIGSAGASVIHVRALNGIDTRILPRPQFCADAGAPAFSPDGRQLAFVCTSSVAVYGVYISELPSGPPRLLTSMQGYPKGLAWTPKGLIVANDAGDGSALWRLTLSGRLSRLPVAEESLGPGVTIAAGRIAFVREKHLLDIWRADLRAPAESGRKLITSTRTQLVPQYSPDGTHIAFQSTRSGSSEIWIADADGGTPMKLTSFKGPLTGAPDWCSDNRRIAFDSRASGTSAIFIVDIRDSRPHRLETSRTNLALPVWSEDCQWIFASDGRAALYRVPASGGPAVRFTEQHAYRVAVSGRRVVFNVAGNSGVELWTKSIEGGAESALVGMPRLKYSDSWAVVPRGIYFTESRMGASGVRFYDFASQRISVVRDLQGMPEPLGGLGISVSRDERWILYTRTEDWQGDIMMVAGREGLGGRAE